MKYFIIFFFLLQFLTSCTTTTTRTKEPVFNTSTISLENELNALVSCKGINLNGKETTENGNVTSELEIHITNGQNIPTDDAQMIDLGKKIAIVIKKGLKDSSEFQTFRVLFITETDNSGISTQTWKGKTFKIEEL
jgi:hypothetical protein